MSRNNPALWLAIALSLVAAGVADARRLPEWPHDRLLKEADLVVLAAAGKSEPAADKWDGDYAYELDGINTRFTVKVALKGEIPKDGLTVLHYRMGRLKPGKTVDDQARAAKGGPNLVGFRAEALRVNIGRSEVSVPAPEYLLYLKKRADGRYEPVSGQYDPNLSVRELFPAGMSDGLRAGEEPARPRKR
jgi:hypothetical protein